MDVFEAIKARRSIRQFTDEPIGKDKLEKLLDAARWAPTASNQQRWRFVVVAGVSPWSSAERIFGSSIQGLRLKA